MRATKDAVLMIEPRPRACMCGIAALQHRYTEVRFTSCTRRHASSPVVRIESSSGGEMPALLNAMSSPPNVSTAAWKSASTCSGAVTSTCTNSPPTSSAAALPLTGSTSPTTTCAPSDARRRTEASPMPLAPPVTTATRSTSRRTIASATPLPLAPADRSAPRSLALTAMLTPLSARSPVRRDVDVLLVRERVQRVRAQLAAQPRLLEAPERRRVPHRRVAVHRQVAGLDAPRDAECPPEVPGPDRAGQAVLALVRDPDGVVLVLERHDRDDRAEDLLGERAVPWIGGGEHRRGEPEARAGRRRAAEGHGGVVGDVGGDPLPLAAADQRPHLGGLQRRVL